MAIPLSLPCQHSLWMPLTYVLLEKYLTYEIIGLSNAYTCRGHVKLNRFKNQIKNLVGSSQQVTISMFVKLEQIFCLGSEPDFAFYLLFLCASVSHAHV